MKIKKFKARNFSEALELVKKELSEDAIILSTEERKGIRPFVEVTAAVDYEITPCHSGSGGNLPGQSHRLRPGPEIFKDKTPLFCQDDMLADIRNEIGNLKAIIENMKNHGYKISLSAKKRRMLHYLGERSIREEFALRLCEEAKDLGEIPLLISRDIKIRKRDTNRKAVMLIGPTGVGKTTTIAKLSSLAIKEGKKAAIVNLDTYRIGAVEQVRIYSRIMGIPLSIVSNIRELGNSILKFAESRDIIFIDTTGRNPRDESYINELAEICQTKVNLELHLLMSANCDDEFMLEAYRFYKRLPVDYIAFTKVDEAVRFGSLYNLLLTYQKPVAYITTGQKVPGDIEFVTADKLANLIIKKESYKC